MKLNQHALCRLLATTLLLSAFAVCSYGQSDTDSQPGEYATIPIAKTGNKWSVPKYPNTTISKAPYSRNEKMEPGSTLSILGQENTWHILKTKREDIDGQLYKISETMISTIGKTVEVSGKTYTEIIESDSLGKIHSTNLLREEEGKLYWFSPHNKRDVLIFDYNAKQGDVLSLAWMEGSDEMIRVVVETIESINFAGKSRRAYRLKLTAINTESSASDLRGSNATQYQWIEGLGSPEYGWRALLILLTGGFPNQLLCVSDANGDWTKDPKIGCNYYKKELLKGWPDSMDPISGSDREEGYVWSKDGTLVVHSNDSTPQNLLIHTMSGEMIYHNPVFRGEEKISMNRIAKGDVLIIRVGDKTIKHIINKNSL